MSVFETLAKIDVNSFTEKKGQFTYLSWADAVNVLLENYPEATWQIRHNQDGWPYFPCPAGAFVEVELTIEGVTRIQVHPVLDYKNKPISEPDSFQVNTAIQRCLAKAISLHGLGLYIYRGEDLPESPNKQQVNPEPIDRDKVQRAFEYFRDKIDDDDIELNHEVVKKAYTHLTSDERIAVNDLLKGLGPINNRGLKYSTVLKKYLEYVHVPDAEIPGYEME